MRFCLKFLQELRRLICTTNTIEGFNRQLRKVTKTKPVFPTDDNLFKILYLAMMDIIRSGQGGGRTGVRSTHNCRSTLPAECSNGRNRPTRQGQKERQRSPPSLTSISVPAYIVGKRSLHSRPHHIFLPRFIPYFGLYTEFGISSGFAKVPASF